MPAHAPLIPKYGAIMKSDGEAHAPLALYHDLFGRGGTIWKRY